jgi:hypothetical protein
LAIPFIEIHNRIVILVVDKPGSVASEDLEPKVFHLVLGLAFLIGERSIIWSLDSKHDVLSLVDLHGPLKLGKFLVCSAPIGYLGVSFPILVHSNCGSSKEPLVVFKWHPESSVIVALVTKIGLGVIGPLGCVFVGPWTIVGF